MAVLGGSGAPGAAHHAYEKFRHAPTCSSLFADKVHRGGILREIVGHGFDQRSFLNGFPITSSAVTTKHSLVCFCLAVSSWSFPLRALLEASSTGMVYLPGVLYTGDSADGVGMSLADALSPKV